MSRYQLVNPPVLDYTGGMYPPHNTGIEYDWQVPNDMVVASPGGTSAIYNHYTKGWYGSGNTSSDIYAGQGDRYISGPYGNLYQPGNAAVDSMGMYGPPPDYSYVNNMKPMTKIPEADYSLSRIPNSAITPTAGSDFTANDPTVKKRENYDNLEIIAPSDEFEALADVSSNGSGWGTGKMSWTLFFVFILAFIGFILVYTTAKMALDKYGFTSSLKNMTIISTVYVISAVLIICTFL